MSTRCALPFVCALLVGCPPVLGGGDRPPLDDDDDTEADDDDSVDDDDATEEPRFPFLVEVSPEPDATDFFYEANLWAEFDIPPDDASLSLWTEQDEELGDEVEGTVTSGSNGRLLTFDPDAPLTPDTRYIFVIEWAPTDSAPYWLRFATSEHGIEVPDPESMVGRAYSIDLSVGRFVEPPGVGAIIGSQLSDLRVLMSATEDSDFLGGAVHVLAGAATEAVAVEQDPCTATALLSAGVDGVVGTADDSPAVWGNPRITLGPLDLGELAYEVQGIDISIENGFMSSTFDPDLDDLRGGGVRGLVRHPPPRPGARPRWWGGRHLPARV